MTSMVPDDGRGVESAIVDVAAGKPVRIVDDCRASTSISVLAAEKLTAATAAAMRGGPDRSLRVVDPTALRDDALSDCIRAAIALVRFAGLPELAIICVSPLVPETDTGPAPLPTAREAGPVGMRSITVTALERYELSSRIDRVAEASLQMRQGIFMAAGYRSDDGREHLALMKGRVQGATEVFLAVHEACITGHALGSMLCDCGGRLASSLDQLAHCDAGVLIHLAGHSGLDGLAGLRDGAGVESLCPAGSYIDKEDCALAAGIVLDLAPISLRLRTAEPELASCLARFGIAAEQQLNRGAHLSAC